MKFRCPCGHQVVDQTDSLPYKGYLVPDSKWNGLLEAFDSAISADQPTEAESDRLTAHVYSFFKEVYQCPSCRRLFVSRGNDFDLFLPEDSEPRDVLNE